MNEVNVVIKLNKYLDKATGKIFDMKIISSIEPQIVTDNVKSYINFYVNNFIYNDARIQPIKLFFNNGKIFKKISNKVFMVLDENFNEYKINTDTLQVLFPDFDTTNPTFIIRLKVNVEYHYTDKEVEEYWEGSLYRFTERLVEDKNFENACLNKNTTQLYAANLENNFTKQVQKEHLENCFKIQ